MTEQHRDPWYTPSPEPKQPTRAPKQAGAGPHPILSTMIEAANAREKQAAPCEAHGRRGCGSSMCVPWSQEEIEADHKLNDPG
jgi:hypothetical protein